MMITGETSEALTVAKRHTGGESVLTGGEYDLGRNVTDASTPRQFSGKQERSSLATAPKTPRGHVRHDLREAMRIATDASDRLAIAGQASDGPAIAVAANDLSEALAVMWHFREFGEKEWRQILQVCQQVLCEPDEYEDIQGEQALAIQTVVHSYVPQRFALPRERREAMQVLRDAGFDIFRLISDAN